MSTWDDDQSYTDAAECLCRFYQLLDQREGFWGEIANALRDPHPKILHVLNSMDEYLAKEKELLTDGLGLDPADAREVTTGMKLALFNYRTERELWQKDPESVPWFDVDQIRSAVQIMSHEICQIKAAERADRNRTVTKGLKVALRLLAVAVTEFVPALKLISAVIELARVLQEELGT